MKNKIILTQSELNEYNRLKTKIKLARTTTEVSAYSTQAKEILDTGRKRYISQLENKRITFLS
ncbi:hypothetical protein [Paenibacillus tengchongensis]|uniref:hypothetical protein n=1 Tax=Paenibacillus tengchongensis TaxID=2608684 RepID=UPI00124BF234|nr:hypothetical protein [Paenibacillus tengchongensis]